MRIDGGTQLLCKCCRILLQWQCQSEHNFVPVQEFLSSLDSESSDGMNLRYFLKLKRRACFRASCHIVHVIFPSCFRVFFFCYFPSVSVTAQHVCCDPFESPNPNLKCRGFSRCWCQNLALLAMQSYFPFHV